jgi:hypothetical protein
VAGSRLEVDSPGLVEGHRRRRSSRSLTLCICE